MNLFNTAWLILDVLLPADTHLVDQEWALGAWGGIRVAVVLDVGVTTAPRSGTIESAFGRTSTAGLRWLKHSSSA